MKRFIIFSIISVLSGILLLAGDASANVYAASSETEGVQYIDDPVSFEEEGDKKDAMRTEYEAAVATILSGIQSNWSDLEKVIYIHDYITSHTEYAFKNGQPDHTVPSSSAYWCLVKHRAVCCGYANAFYDLANRAGVETYEISSDDLDHAWNMVVLNGKHYYIDVTWDGQEPGDDALRTHFLKSGSQFYLSHTSRDWVIEADPSGYLWGEDAIPVFGKYDDREYDNAVWEDVSKPMIHRDGAMYYASDGNICKNTGNPDSEVVLREGMALGTMFYSLFEAGGEVFAVTDDGVYLYDIASNGLTKIYTLSKNSEVYENHTVEGYTLKLVLRNYSTDDTVTKSINLQAYMNAPKLKNLKLSENVHRSYKTGDSFTLSATTEPAGFPVSKWESSDTNVATVDANGKVTVKNYGAAYIKAYCGDMQAWCLVGCGQLKATTDTMYVSMADNSYFFAAVDVTPGLYGSLFWESDNPHMGLYFNTTTERTGHTGLDVSAKGIEQNILWVNGPGEANITVHSYDGKLSTSFKVVVSDPVTNVFIRNYPYGTGSRRAGVELDLEAGYSPYKPTGDMTETWKSSDTSIATVDQKGHVKFLKPGKAVISCTIQGVTGTVEFTVQEPLNDKYNYDDNGGDSYEDPDHAPDYIEGWDCKWYALYGKCFWYEGGYKQGTVNDPKGVWGDGTNRGREIFDAQTDGWYWLDAAYDGQKAVGKEVWMPYIYQDEDSWSDEQKEAIARESDPGMEECVLSAINSKAGKWVRYDEFGRMLKGWVTIEGWLEDYYPDQIGNTYYYDTRTGLMAKGDVTIDGVTYHFDEVTGVLQ